MLLRKLMNWNSELKNLRERNERENREREERIRDLRRRIEELRSSLYSTQPRRVCEDDEVAEPIRNVEQTEREKRNAELDAMKAKLLGRKK